MRALPHCTSPTHVLHFIVPASPHHHLSLTAHLPHPTRWQVSVPCRVGLALSATRPRHVRLPARAIRTSRYRAAVNASARVGCQRRGTTRRYACRGTRQGGEWIQRQGWWMGVRWACAWLSSPVCGCCAGSRRQMRPRLHGGGRQAAAALLRRELALGGLFQPMCVKRSTCPYSLVLGVGPWWFKCGSAFGAGRPRRIVIQLHHSSKFYSNSRVLLLAFTTRQLVLYCSLILRQSDQLIYHNLQSWPVRPPAPVGARTRQTRHDVLLTRFRASGQGVVTRHTVSRGRTAFVFFDLNFDQRFLL